MFGPSEKRLNCILNSEYRMKGEIEMKKAEIIERVNELVQERQNLIQDREHLLERENILLDQLIAIAKELETMEVD